MMSAPATGDGKLYWGGFERAGSSSHRPSDGLPSDTWLAFDVEVPSRNPASWSGSFAAGIYGCRTDHTGRGGRGGANRASVVTAYCAEATIAMLAFPDVTEARVRIGCE